MCDAETVDFENDTMAGDVVDRDAVFENTQVHYNPKQKWYYLPNQMPSELLIFKNADSESKFDASSGKCTDFKTDLFTNNTSQAFLMHPLITPTPRTPIFGERA
jgi:hypothetical protein